METLTPEEIQRLESLNWVLYMTEDGEEYFGQVGTDHTQWDVPDDLEESDVELLRLALANISDSEEVEELEDSSQTFSDLSKNNTKTISSSATATVSPEKMELPEEAANLGGTSSSDIAIDNLSPSTSSKSDTLTKCASRRGSFHPAPSLKRDSILGRAPSAKDIKLARQASGRKVHNFSPKSAHTGLRRALEVLNDSEIRSVLLQLGEEDKSIHAFTRMDMVDIVFDGSRTDKDILKALGEVTAARDADTKTNDKNNGETKNNFPQVGQSHHLKQTRSSAIGMSRHSSFKTSTGAASVGLNSPSEWSLEAQATVKVLSALAKDVLKNTNTTIGAIFMQEVLMYYL